MQKINIDNCIKEELNCIKEEFSKIKLFNLIVATNVKSNQTYQVRRDITDFKLTVPVSRKCVLTLEAS